jgi:protein SCO1
MSSKWLVLIVSGLLACAALSCKEAEKAAAPTPPNSTIATNLRTFQVKGVVREIIPDRKKIKITHEEIPDYMEAMTMMLDVKDAKELSGLQAGDSISFRMLVTEDDGWIDQLKKLDEPRTPLPSEQPPMRRVRDVEPLAVGDAMPEYTFTNTQGRVVRLSEFKGTAYALTFIFTRCPFPTFCPRLSSSFQEAQQQLKAMSGGPTNWHLFSITIEPEYDTLPRLQDYATRYKADPARWDHLTGELIDITAISEQFGLQFWRANPNEPINHNVRTVVIDAAGRVHWITPETEWKPAQLVEQLLKAAAVKPADKRG